MIFLKTLSYRTLVLLVMACATAFVTAGCSSSESESPDGSEDTRAQQNSADGSPSVLIVGGHADHDFDRWFNQEDTAIIGETGASVAYTDDPNAIAGQLPDLDILYLSNNQPLADPDLQQTIHEFVRSGGSLLLVHAAIWFNWQDDWPEYYRDFTGGGSPSHPPFGEFEVYLTEESHPLTQGIPARFTVTDELYRFQRVEDGTQMNVLAMGIEPGSGDEYPVIWTTEYGDGNIVNITLGHDGETHEHPVYIRLLENSIAWLYEN